MNTPAFSISRTLTAPSAPRSRFFSLRAGSTLALVLLLALFTGLGAQHWVALNKAQAQLQATQDVAATKALALE